MQKDCKTLPKRSECLYVSLSPADVAMFRFMFESRDNLGYFSMIDNKAAVAKVIFAPGQRGKIMRFLGDISEEVRVEVLP